MSSRTGTIGVIGLGLIGGSVALDARDQGWPLLATDTDPKQRAAAEAAGIAVTADVAQIARAAELVIVATPAPQVADVLAELDAHAEGPLVASAVASVQSAGVLNIDSASFRFVRHLGGHPMTGTERSGFKAARRGMFDGSPWIVTPSVGDDLGSFQAVVGLALALRAAPVVLPPDEHDRTVALLSHLPHVLAYTLQAQLAGFDGVGTEHLAGGSFRDATRVAATRPSFWAEVLHLNRAAVVELLDGVLGDLGAMRELLAGPADVPSIQTTLERGHRAVGRHRAAVPEPTALPEVLDDATIVALQQHTAAGLAIASFSEDGNHVAWTAL